MPDIKVLQVPKWGLSMQEGTISAWLIGPEAEFVKGQEICEIESSKISNVLEAPFSGRLRRILASPGDIVPVQGVIAVCAPSEVSDAEVEAYVQSMTSGALAVAGQVELAALEHERDTNREAAKGVATVNVESTTGVGSGSSPPAEQPENNYMESEKVVVPLELLGCVSENDGILATPRARVYAREHSVALENISGSGRRNRISVSDIRHAIIVAGGVAPSHRDVLPSLVDEAGGRGEAGVAATPVARRLARELGIALSGCRTTGRNHRVCKADVEAEAYRRHGVVGDRQSGIPPRDASTETPVETSVLVGMRKTIAKRLQHSKQEAPHFRVAMECQVDELLKFRRQLNEQHPAAKVSINDFVVKAVATALLEVPELNIQFDGENIRHFEHADIAVAVALKDGGLITPIVRRADTRSLLELSGEIQSLVTRAKAGTLADTDFQGGTFTVSNLGMYGVTHFDAIINPPQAAILAVGAVQQRLQLIDSVPVVVNTMILTAASDHRVIDGVLVARFLQAVQKGLQSPLLMLA